MNKQNQKLSPEQLKELESFKKWLEDKNYAPKNLEEVKKYYALYQKEKTKKALHGAKLNYFRSLKNQCPEGEELYYYKKGGKAGCGCRKKEDGGEIKKAQKGSAVDNFKNRKKEIKQEPPKQDLAARDSIRINSVKGDDELEAVRPGSYKPNPKHNPKDPNSKTHIWVPDRTKEPYKKDKVKKDCGGSAIKKFKMHRLGGSLNRIPFYLKGTVKNGITEKSDNTRVQRISNKGEGVYKEIPVNGWDFVPIVGTFREALRLDLGDPNASITRLGISLAGDLAGAGMVGSVAKAAGKAGRIQKALKAKGFFKPTNTSKQWIKIGTKETPINAGRFGTIGTKTEPAVFTKTIPTVDYAPAAMTPLVLTLRVPAEAPFFNYSK